MEDWQLSKHNTKSGLSIEEITVDIKALNLFDAYKNARCNYENDKDTEFNYYLTYTDRTYSKRGKHYFTFKVYRYKK